MSSVASIPLRYSSINGLKPLAAATLLGTMFAAHAALAQEEQLESSTIEAVANESAEASTGTVEEVIVTGSRLRSSTYSSISPLQIIDAEFQREVGLIDATEILQNSTNAGGQQIDLTFNGFVLDNGPGSTTISLRGLGANRTLVLMNGRRLAPSGVEGAPSAPNISLVPRIMVSKCRTCFPGSPRRQGRSVGPDRPSGPTRRPCSKPTALMPRPGPRCAGTG